MNFKASFCRVLKVVDQETMKTKAFHLFSGLVMETSVPECDVHIMGILHSNSYRGGSA